MQHGVLAAGLGLPRQTAAAETARADLRKAVADHAACHALLEQRRLEQQTGLT